MRNIAASALLIAIWSFEFLTLAAFVCMLAGFLLFGFK